jgi:hypothetical protein
VINRKYLSSVCTALLKLSPALCAVGVEVWESSGPRGKEERTSLQTWVKMMVAKGRKLSSKISRIFPWEDKPWILGILHEFINKVGL